MNEEFGKSNHIDEPTGPVADCIICGAGASLRMGEWKLSLPWPPSLHRSTPHEPWLADAAVAAAIEAGCRVILVVGFRGDELEARYAQCPGVTIVRNERWDQGMVSSIQAGLSQVRSPWFFVAHGDMPRITADWYKRLLARRPATLTGNEALALRPLYVAENETTGQKEQHTVPGHPVLFSASAIPLIQKAPEGDSLKTVLSACRVIPVETQDDSVVSDVDTLEQYCRALVSLTQPIVLVHEVPPASAEKGPTQPLQQAGATALVQIITGMQGAGKTSLLRRTAFQEFINLLESDSSSRSLFFMISQVQRGRNADGKALGFDIEAFYRTAEGRLSFFKQPLCRTDPTNFPIQEPIMLGPYYFKSESFTALTDWLKGAIESPADVLYGYIDELGKLELDQHRGLWPLFEGVLQTLSQANSGTGKHRLVCTVRQDRVEVLEQYLQQRGFSVQVTKL